MNASIHHRIRLLIEETNDAFSSCGSVNADYAEFATLALSEFKHLLHKPELTRRQLTTMLRSGIHEHKGSDPESPWTTFLADYIAKTSNKSGKSI